MVDGYAATKVGERYEVWPAAEIPTAVEGLVYNGNAQTGVVEKVGFTLTGNVATNAGDYTATATLADGYCWTDGSLTNKFIAWSILPPPTFDITIAKSGCVTDVRTNGVSVVGTLALPADATTVALELVSTNTIPVFKFRKNDGDWAVTNKTPVIAIAANDTLTFMAEEAKMDDPNVSDEQVTAAIIDAIDEGQHKATVVAKVEAITSGEDPIEPKALAKWITDRTISSVDMAASDYLKASVNLDTSAPITDAAEVKFVEVDEVSSDAFTFEFELTLSGKETPEELAVEAEKLAGYIETTGDLSTGFETTVDPSRVTIDPATGKVSITPDPTKSSEFFKIVIPRDK